LPELAAIAKAVPDLTIVLKKHLGGLTRIGPYANRDEEVLATWRRGIAALAPCRNVNLKLGGISMPRLGFDCIQGKNRSARWTGSIDGPADDLLHRTIGSRPVHVRKQFPGR
jgi:hypothetical protein